MVGEQVHRPRRSTVHRGHHRGTGASRCRSQMRRCHRSGSGSLPVPRLPHVVSARGRSGRNRSHPRPAHRGRRLDSPLAVVGVLAAVLGHAQRIRPHTTASGIVRREGFGQCRRPRRSSTHHHDTRRQLGPGRRRQLVPAAGRIPAHRGTGACASSRPGSRCGLQGEFRAVVVRHQKTRCSRRR